MKNRRPDRYKTRDRGNIPRRCLFLHFHWPIKERAPFGKKPRAFKTARRRMCNLRNPSATQGFVFGVFLVRDDNVNFSRPLCRCRVSTLQQEGLEFNFSFHWHTSQTGRACLSSTTRSQNLPSERSHDHDVISRTFDEPLAS